MVRKIRIFALASAVLILSVLVIGNVSAAETPTIGWQKVLGGSGSDQSLSIDPTSDGGYILTGWTYSSASGDVTGTNHGNSDVWVVKLDRTGAITWQKALGGSGNDDGFSIRQTNDGGYILTGQTTSSASGDVTGTNNGGYDVWVVKLDSTGTIVWQKLFGTSSDEWGYGIEQTSDGGYIISGMVNSLVSSADYLVIRLDSTGTIVWQKVLGGSDEDVGYGIGQTSDGGYIVIGWTYSSKSGDVTGTNHGDYDIWVVKLNSSGVIVWQKLLGGNDTDKGANIHQTSDGGYILTGWTYSSKSGDVTGTNNGGYDVWVVKLSSTGAISWQKLFGTIDWERGWDIQQTPDGGYIVSGTAFSSGSVADYLVIRLDSTGQVIWQKVLGGSDEDAGYGIGQTGDGGYVVTGWTYSNNSGDVGMSHGDYDIWVVKLKTESAEVSPIYGYSDPPTDPDNDGLYEDLNANGFADWDDAVVLFWNTDWIQENEPLECFDFNGNTFIDWDDAVTLFWHE